MRGISLWLLLVAAPAIAEPVAAPTVYVVRRGWHIDVGFAAREKKLRLKR